MASDAILRLRDKVNGILTNDLGYKITVDGVGDTLVAFAGHHVFCWVSCQEMKSGTTWIGIWVDLLKSMPKSPELFEYVALHSGDYIFGHLVVRPMPDQPEQMRAKISHSLLGDYLDAEELKVAFQCVISTADDLIPELKGKFGGKTMDED